MRTRITELFGIDHPIILAPMGGVAGGELAAAVARAGGLGLIGCGYGNPSAGYGSIQWIDDQFEAAGNEKVGAGFISWSLAERPELLDRVLDRGTGSALPLLWRSGALHPENPGRGAQAHPPGRIARGGKRCSPLGADVIVAQGSEAGGHGAAKRTLFSLLPEVVDAVHPVPVLAAGGVSDGRGLAAALMLGAEGVLVGTRLFASREALGGDALKRRIVESTGDNTVRTRVFDLIRRLDWPSGYTGRAIANRFTRTWHGREEELTAVLGSEEARYWAARDAGDVETAVLFAGEGTGLIHDFPSAAEVVGRMVREAEALLSRAPDRLE
jgi:nitronate monooxygenase